jgi:hypothetical protein
VGAVPLLLPLLLLLLLPLLLPSLLPSPLQLLLPAQNSQLSRAAGPVEVLHPLPVSPLLLCLVCQSKVLPLLGPGPLGSCPWSCCELPAMDGTGVARPAPPHAPQLMEFPKGPGASVLGFNWDF